MTSLFQGEVNSEEERNLPRLAGLVAAGLAFCGISFWEIQAIFRSGSSTAAIGLIFVPIVGAIAAIPGFFAGWCLGFFLCHWQSTVKRRRILAIAVVLIPVAVITWVSFALRDGMNLSKQVHQIEAMNAEELESLFNSSPQSANKFILAAIAQNPNATAPILHRIVALERPELYEPMGSHFDVNGKNTKGLAVMRLIARHPNVAAADLEKLAMSTNKYVLGDAAANPKLSAATLRKLATRSNYLVECGLARNPQTAPDVLLKLASSADESTRASVASNLNASAEVLKSLSADQSSYVRLNVAQNLSTSRNIIEQLTFDSAPEVSRAARNCLKKPRQP